MRDSLESAVGQADVGGRANLGPSPGPGPIALLLGAAPVVTFATMTRVNEEDEQA